MMTLSLSLAHTRTLSLLDLPNHKTQVLGCGSREMCEVRQAKGVGYALSTQEELQLVQQVAAATGVILDPVYSGRV